MGDFWERAFQEKQRMWGQEPAAPARPTAARFAALGFRSVLIPGIGYGRNAAPFVEAGLAVTGVEVSPTAIDLAREHFGPRISLIEGSALDLDPALGPFEGVFCHALVHLFGPEDRRRLLAGCHGRLAPGGLMVFTAIGPDPAARARKTPGVDLYFYDEGSIEGEFGPWGLESFAAYQEPARDPQGPSTLFWRITCRKA